MSEPTPIGIKADRSAETLTIKWNNGEVYSIPFGLLRNACPCADCRGGHENMKKEPDEDAFSIKVMSSEATKLLAVEAVGGYAIQVTWGDGHKFGIYNWHYLYALCQGMDKPKL
jgi:DUF971 family protein